jgi:hypothetical protein
LKDQVDGPVEIAGRREIPGRAEQHCGVPVMAASVHLAGGFGCIGQSGRLFDRKRVHVGPKPDRPDISLADRLASLDNANDAGTAKAGRHFIATELPKTLGHKCRRAVLVVSEFGVLMDIAAPRLDIGLQVGHAVDNGHENLWAKSLMAPLFSMWGLIGPIPPWCEKRNTVH